MKYPRMFCIFRKTNFRIHNTNSVVFCGRCWGGCPSQNSSTAPSLELSLWGPLSGALSLGTSLWGSLSLGPSLWALSGALSLGLSLWGPLSLGPSFSGALSLGLSHTRADPFALICIRHVAVGLTNWCVSTGFENRGHNAMPPLQMLLLLAATAAAAPAPALDSLPPPALSAQLLTGPESTIRQRPLDLEGIPRLWLPCACPKPKQCKPWQPPHTPQECLGCTLG